MGDERMVFWVSKNERDLPVVYDRGRDAYLIAITPDFMSMTVGQRLAVEVLVRKVGSIAEWVNAHG